MATTDTWCVARLCNDIGYFMLRQIAPSFVATQPVAYDDFVTASGQRRDNMRANESGATRYDIHLYRRRLTSTLARL